MLVVVWGFCLYWVGVFACGGLCFLLVVEHVFTFLTGLLAVQLGFLAIHLSTQGCLLRVALQVCQLGQLAWPAKVAKPI